MTSLRIAIHQWDCHEGDEDSNRSEVDRALGRAAEEGAAILALPELWLTGYDLERSTAITRDTDADVEWIRQRAREHGVACLAGSLLECEASSASAEVRAPRYYNRAVVIDADGQLVSTYRKLHRFGPLGEDRFVNAGDAVPEPFDLSELRCGQAVCYDLRFAELFRAIATRGVDLVHVPAQWPLPRNSHWKALLSGRAVELQSYVVGVNRKGRFGSFEFGGASRVVDPNGKVVLDAGDDHGTFFVDIDPSLPRRTREALPYLDDVRTDLSFRSPGLGERRP